MVSATVTSHVAAVRPLRLLLRPLAPAIGYSPVCISATPAAAPLPAALTPLLTFCCLPSHCNRGADAGVGSDSVSASVSASASFWSLSPVLPSIPWLKVGFRAGRMTFSLSFCPFSHFSSLSLAF